MHLESNTNILLFLAHLSKDPVVIDELVTSSEDLYSRYMPAELQNDISFLTDLGLSLCSLNTAKAPPAKIATLVMADWTILSSSLVLAGFNTMQPTIRAKTTNTARTPN